ncbi:MAG: ASCH domain-containing protein [Chloroflexi bacterium]|nr:ASCH domain-containing protein [Chloroflexota bacterium]
MLLFKPWNVENVLSGRKTQTRRLWKRSRVKEGSRQKCVTRLFGEPFATVRVLRVWQEPLGAISEADARAEGFESRDQFLKAFEEINGRTDPRTHVWAVEFRVEDR